MNDMTYALMQALGAGGAEWSRQSQLSRQNKVQDEDRARRAKLEADALAREAQRDTYALEDRAFQRGRVEAQDKRTAAEFGVRMNDEGYTPYAGGEARDVNLRDLPGMGAVGGVGNAMLDIGLSKQADRFGGYAKTKESAGERQLSIANQRAEALAQTMGLPKGLSLQTLEKLAIDRNNQPRTQYDSARGAMINMETGSAQPVAGLPDKIVDPQAQAMRDMSIGMRQDSQDLKRLQLNQGNVDTLKRQYDSETVIKNSKERADAFNGVLNALKVNNPLGDINVIYSLVKVFDPGSVVKEGEIKLTQKANSLPGQVKLIVQNMKEGRMVTDQQKQWVRELIAMQADDSQIKPVQKRYGQRVRELNLTPSDSAFIAPSPYENLNVPRKGGNPF